TVKARRRIQDHVARRELDLMDAIGVLDEQLTAVVLVRLRKKERGGEIGSKPVRRAADLPDRVVDVIAKRLSAAVAVEQRRKHLEWQGGRHKQRVALQGRHDRVAQLSGGGRILRQLFVVLRTRRLVSGGDAAVDPRRTLEDAAGVFHLGGGQQIRN